MTKAKEGLGEQGVVAPHNANSGASEVANDIRQTTIKRETWSKKVDFLLSVIGYAVDLANVWRFPYLCFKHGGGAFLIPYVIMAVFAGIPLFYLELALGQYFRRGVITAWGRICPLLKGIGYCVVLIVFFVDVFYNVIIAWSFRFLFASLTSELPWATCTNPWNSQGCYNPGSSMNSSGGNFSVCAQLPETQLNETDQPVSAADEYYYIRMLGFRQPNSSETATVEQPGSLQWEIVLCLLLLYIVCFASMWKGIRTSGKVVWFTTLFPYFGLVSLLIRGITLPGSTEGIKYYLSPDISKLSEGQVWIDAATQVFFSLGPGLGVLLTLSSYNEFHNNVYIDALVTSITNCLTSFLAGFAVFSILGYMSCISGEPIENVASEGPGLVFVVYPQALATMPGSTFWSIAFFLVLVTLGLDSSFGGSEALITALSDEFPLIGRHRKIFMACLFSLFFIVELSMCTQAGVIVVEFFNFFSASFGLLIVVMLEAITVSWIYGLKRFVANVDCMIGSKPGIFWRVCWAYVSPLFLLANIIYGFVAYEPLMPDGHPLPDWMSALGWIMTFSSVLCIPLVAIAQIYKAPGATLFKKIAAAAQPKPMSNSTGQLPQKTKVECDEGTGMSQR